VYLQLDAERNRRVLLCLGLLGLCALQAWWPNPKIAQLGNGLASPVARVFAPLAGKLLPPALDAARPQLSGGDLAAIETKLGQPRKVSGVVWINTPVQQDERSSVNSRLLLGSSDGVGGGVPVVFGSSWLGRAESTSANSAQLHYWGNSDIRTGVWLQAADGGRALRAICIGRGGGQPALVRFIENRCPPLHDSPVIWRHREDDVHSLQQLNLQVGQLQRVGDEARGEGHWVVAGEYPAGAGGRVFTAASAIPSVNRQANLPQYVAAKLLIARDAVFGGDFCAVENQGNFPLLGLVRQGRLVGPVVRQAGDTAWVFRGDLDAWQQRALVWDASTAKLEIFDQQINASSVLFSSGVGIVPRGIFLGHLGDSPSSIAAPLSGIYALPSQLEEEQ